MITNRFPEGELRPLSLGEGCQPLPSITAKTTVTVHVALLSGPFAGRIDWSGGPDACWPWTSGHDTQGYGQGAFGWTRKAHRAVYGLLNPDFDRSLDVCHRCDNPICCNPAHLFAATHQANLQDAGDKGRLGKRKLDWAKVRAIRAAYAAGESQYELHRRYGVAQPLISYIVNNKRWVERKSQEAVA